jgi:hypothetical protein
MDSSDAGASLRRHSLDVVIAFWSVDRFGQTFEYRYETGPPVDWPDWAEMDTDRPDAAVAIRSGNENIDDGGHGKKALTSKNSFFVAGSLQRRAHQLPPPTAAIVNASSSAGGSIFANAAISAKNRLNDGSNAN